MIKKWMIKQQESGQRKPAAKKSGGKKSGGKKPVGKNQRNATDEINTLEYCIGCRDSLVCNGVGK